MAKTIVDPLQGPVPLFKIHTRGEGLKKRYDRRKIIRTKENLLWCKIFQHPLYTDETFKTLVGVYENNFYMDENYKHKLKLWEALTLLYDRAYEAGRASV